METSTMHGGLGDRAAIGSARFAAVVSASQHSLSTPSRCTWRKREGPLRSQFRCTRARPGLWSHSPFKCPSKRRWPCNGSFDRDQKPPPSHTPGDVTGLRRCPNTTGPRPPVGHVEYARSPRTQRLQTQFSIARTTSCDDVPLLCLASLLPLKPILALVWGPSVYLLPRRR
jgi:hypothetical protein